FWGQRGPVEGIAADPCYLDIWVPPGTRKALKVETERHAFAYVFEGDGSFRDSSGPQPVPTEDVSGDMFPLGVDIGNRSLVLFDTGDEVVVKAGDNGMRFLLVSGRPLREPVAWHGPIVMNTRDELVRAYQELEQGTFVR
ncbi:MAG: pirin-like C-terminal cupin domain-containing protein, partial [Gemmatimonadales bacterium]